MSMRGKNKEKSRKWNFSKVLRNFILRPLLYIFYFIAGLSLLLTVLSNTSSFRKWSAEKISGIINNELKAKVNFTDFGFSFLHGIDLYNVSLLTGKDTLFYSRMLSVDADFMKIAENKIVVHRLIMEFPEINILRNPDSVWNFDEIAYPSEDTSSSEKSNLKIDISRFEINEGKLTFRDKTSGSRIPGQFVPSDIVLDDLNIIMGAKANLKRDRIAVRFKRFTFRESNSGFKLNNLSFTADIDQENIAMKNMKVKTPYSNLDIECYVAGFNVMDPESKFGDANLDIFLDFYDLSNKDIDFFPQIPVNLGYPVSLTGKFSGEPDNINIKHLSVYLQESQLKFTGEVNDAISGIVKYHAIFDDSYINKSDLVKFLPDYGLESIPDYPRIYLTGTDVRGSTDTVYGKINLSGLPGTIQGFGAVGFGSSPLTYTCRLEMYDVNLKPVVKNENFSSSLTGYLVAQGSGTDPMEMNNQIDFRANKSKFFTLDFNKMRLAATAKDGRFLIDTMNMEMDFSKSGRPDYLTGESNTISVSGEFDINHFDSSKYDLNVDFTGIDLSYLFSNKSLPQYFSGSLKTKSKGLKPDDFEGTFKADIFECLFGDRSLIPFVIDLDFKKSGPEDKSLQINSDFLNASLEGKFNYSELIPTLADHIDYLAEYLSSILPDPSNPGKRITKRKSAFSTFGNIDVVLSAKVHDISPLGIFLENININFDADLAARISAKDSVSNFRIDSIEVSSFDLETGSLNLSTNPISFGGGFEIALQDSVNRLDYLSLMMNAGNNIYINDVVLTMPQASIGFRNDTADYYVSTLINNKYYGSLAGILERENNNLNLIIDNLEFEYDSVYKWENSGIIDLRYGESGIELKNLVLQRNGAENININGKLSDDNFDNVNIDIHGFPVSDITPMLLANRKDEYPKASGTIEEFSIRINGSLKEPIINTKLKSGEIKLNEFDLGKLDFTAGYEAKKITGNLGIYRNKDTVVHANIRSVPFAISFSDTTTGFHKESELLVDIYGENFPLELLSGILPAISNPSGIADISLSTSGFYPERIDYNGKIDIKRSSFVLDGTNLRYYASGIIDVSKDKLTLDKLYLQNPQKYIRNGSAEIDGTITLKEFNPEYIDLYFRSKKIMLMNPSTVHAIPTLYGDFVISTGTKPLHFFGTMLEPNLEGDVNILLADLTLPNTNAGTKARSSFRYIRTYKGYYITDSLNLAARSKDYKGNSLSGESSADFADLINYDLNIKIPGRFNITMELFPLSELTANIGTRGASRQIRYVKKRNQKSPELFGELMIQPGSKFKLYKTFNASGSISFPTGQVDNPGMDINAEYKTTSIVDNERKEYRVLMNLSGTKNNPKLKFRLFVNEEERLDDSTNITRDALFVVLTGKTLADQQNVGTSIGEDVTSSGFALGTSYLLNQILGDIGSEDFQIRSIDIDLGSTGSFDDARLKLTGETKGIRWELGGSSADYYELTIDVPLTDFLNLTFTTSQDPNTHISTDDKIWEFKLKFGQ